MIATCNCGCHIGAGKNIGCCTCPKDEERKSYLNQTTIDSVNFGQSYCICHNPWNGTVPPQCYCTCNVQVQYQPWNWQEELKKLCQPQFSEKDEKVKKLEEKVTKLEQSLEELLKDKKIIKCIICDGKGVVWG